MKPIQAPPPHALNAALQAAIRAYLGKFGKLPPAAEAGEPAETWLSRLDAAVAAGTPLPEPDGQEKSE